MLFIKAYYFFFGAIMFSVANLCLALSWLNRLLLEGTGELPFHHRRSLAPTLRWPAHRRVLENFFRLRFRDHSV